MTVRVFDWYTFSQEPTIWKSALKKWMRMFFDISALEKIELNMREWIIAMCMAMRQGDVSPFPETDLFSITFIRCFLLKVPVTKFIHIIIERGFNEGKMFLTFECHSLLLPAVLWLLRDKAAPLWQTCAAFMRMVFQKSDCTRSQFQIILHSSL